MRAYKNIFLLNTEEHYNLLSMVEKLASQHKEYRRIVSAVAKAQTQTEEIETLLQWRMRVNDYHDIKHTSSIVYYYTPKASDKPYAGGLDDNGNNNTFQVAAYGQTLFDLYMEVLQLIAYRFYHIKPIEIEGEEQTEETYYNVVVPVSACDAHERYIYESQTT